MYYKSFIFYEDQKRDKIKAAQEERLRSEKEKKEKEALEKVDECEPEPEIPIPEKVCEDEPEPEIPIPEKIFEDEPCSIVSDKPAPGGASDLERALNDEDPWMAQKNKET